jgi:hypothetical protein
MLKENKDRATDAPQDNCLLSPNEAKTATPGTTRLKAHKKGVDHRFISPKTVGGVRAVRTRLVQALSAQNLTVECFRLLQGRTFCTPRSGDGRSHERHVVVRLTQNRAHLGDGY